MAWVFLAFGGCALALTINALWPIRRHRPWIVQSFFAGWLTGEAPLHHLAFQLSVSCLFIALGALAELPGVLGLLACVLSMLGLFRLYREAHRAEPLLEQVLSLALGASYRTEVRPGAALDGALPWGRLLLPVWLTDPAVRVVRDLAYAPGGPRRTLNVYLPKGPTKHAPVLLQIHGGAWMIGDKAQQARPLVHYMAARGWVVVSINYRLSPWVKWPEHLVDVKLALAWVKEHVAEYGGDPDFIVATGGSAGGHLTSMLALTPNEARFQPGFEQVDTRVQAAIPFYGVYDFTDREKQQHHPGLRMLLERVVVREPFERARELFELGSPLSHVREDAPPFFVIHGTHDSLACIEEARLFVERLRAVSRAQVAFAELPYAQHAFEVFHSPRTLHVIRAAHRFAENVYAQHLARTRGEQGARRQSETTLSLSAE